MSMFAFFLGSLVVFMFVFVLGININVGFWWLPWSNLPGLAW